MILRFLDKKPDVSQAIFLAPNATLIGGVKLAPGTGIWYGAVLRADSNDILIGENTNIQDNAVLHTEPGRPCVVGANVTVGHSAIVHGCTVGDGCLIGMHATLMNGCVIGKNCIIGAGALVPQDMVVPDNSLVLGVPAKVRGEVNAQQAEDAAENTRHYVELARIHAALLREDAARLHPARL